MRMVLRDSQLVSDEVSFPTHIIPPATARPSRASTPISAAGMEINLSDSRRAVMAWDRAPRPSGQVDLF